MPSYESARNAADSITQFSPQRVDFVSLQSTGLQDKKTFKLA